MSLAKRSISSVGWNMLASPFLLVVQILRTIALARLLPVETFGVYALASSLVGFSIVIANFGMGGAFIYRANETKNEEETAAVHFTLKLIFSSAWAIIMTVLTWFFAKGDYRVALLALIAIQFGILLSQTPTLVLTRRVVHRRLVLINTLDVILSSLIAIILALNGVTLWALLATNVVSLVLNVALLYIWRPVWRPQISWVPNKVRYFLKFGSRNLIAEGLLKALNEVDDLWTGIFLGKDAMGFYSRAYTFATYPSKILAVPLMGVVSGTYAEVKDDRRRLSKAFFRSNALLVRSGFFLAGLIALIAPESIRILLTDKWMPMLEAFRLMLIFTMLDPIKITISSLYVAVGKPEYLIRARSIQLAVLIVGLFALGFQFGINGVALSVNLMLVVGVIILLWQARSYVDFSVRKLFYIPLVALVVGMSMSRIFLIIPGVLGSDWRTLFAKSFVFTFVYGSILFALERRSTIQMSKLIIQKLVPNHWLGDNS